MITLEIKNEDAVKPKAFESLSLTFLCSVKVGSDLSLPFSLAVMIPVTQYITWEPPSDLHYMTTLSHLCVSPLLLHP